MTTSTQLDQSELDRAELAQAELDQAEITQQDPQKYLVSGAVNFSTAPNLIGQTVGFFKEQSAKTVTIDFSKVSSCNSAGLALVLEMAKQATNNNIKVQFENLPESMQTIAKAYGVDEEIRDLHK